MSVVGGRLGEDGKVRAVRADGGDVETVGVPPVAVLPCPVSLAGEDYALAVGRPSGGIIPAIYFETVSQLELLLLGRRTKLQTHWSAL